MRYVGMMTQVRRNNQLSILLLLMFPTILLGMVWVFFAIMNYFENGYYDYNDEGNFVSDFNIAQVNASFMDAMPWVIGIVGIWFAIAYFSNTSMIRHAVGARPLTRKENPRVYNIVENLCMTCNMDMPKINVVDDPQLNAFASGIDKNSYTVTLTTGIMELLDDDELAGVIGHELTHIRNRDTRLLITSIIFVGIVSTLISFLIQMMYNMMWFGGGSRTVSTSSDDEEDNKSGGVAVMLVMFVALICAGIAHLFTLLTRFAISRRREYMADAGGAELCGNPLALASALRKISGDPGLQNTGREDIAQLFIIHPDKLKQGAVGLGDSLFATHPDTRKRIEILEQF